MTQGRRGGAALRGVQADPSPPGKVAVGIANIHYHSLPLSLYRSIVHPPSAPSTSDTNPFSCYLGNSCGSTSAKFLSSENWSQRLLPTSPSRRQRTSSGPVAGAQLLLVHGLPQSAESTPTSPYWTPPPLGSIAVQWVLVPDPLSRRACTAAA